MTAPIPRNEADRLASLRELHLLDTAADPLFDAFARLAAEIAGTPIGLISLVDETRQWFKANVGLDGVTETSRDAAFCAHALLETDVLEVPDATLDERFASNPLVTGDPRVRFYAGMPLIDGRGNVLGTLCALDTRPHALSASQRRSLRMLGSTLGALVESRRGVSSAALDRVASLGGALDNAAVPIAILRRAAHGDPTFEFVNRAFTELFGHDVVALVGRGASVLHGARTDPDAIARLRDAVASGVGGSETVYLATSGGEAKLVEVRDRPIDATFRIVSFRDITAVHEATEAVASTNRRLQSLLDNNSDAVITLDNAGACLDANAAAIAIFGYPRESLVGASALRFGSRSLFPSGESFPIDVAAGRNVLFTREFVRADGASVTIDWKTVPIIVGSRVEGAYVIGRDVTSERRLAAALATGAQRLRAIHHIAASRASDRGQIDAALELVLATFGMDFAYVGERIDETLLMRHAVGDAAVPAGTSIPLAMTYVSETIALGEVLVIEDLEAFGRLRGTRPTYDGWHAYISAPLETDAGPYGAIGFLSRRFVTFDEADRDFVNLVAGVIASALERTKAREGLAALAFRDALTGLPNRASFVRELDAAVAEPGHARFAVHFIDLDGFKELNDTYGHLAGDLALQEVGRRIAGALRDERDFAARLGGDEFVVLQRGVDAPGDAEALGRRFVATLAEPYDLDGASARLSASVGIALLPPVGGDAKTMLRAADAQLYRAKREGKNRIAMA